MIKKWMRVEKKTKNEKKKSSRYRERGENKSEPKHLSINL